MSALAERPAEDKGAMLSSGLESIDAVALRLGVPELKDYGTYPSCLPQSPEQYAVVGRAAVTACGRGNIETPAPLPDLSKVDQLNRIFDLQFMAASQRGPSDTTIGPESDYAATLNHTPVYERAAMHRELKEGWHELITGRPPNRQRQHSRREALLSLYDTAVALANTYTNGRTGQTVYGFEDHVISPAAAAAKWAGRTIMRANDDAAERLMEATCEQEDAIHDTASVPALIGPGSGETWKKIGSNLHEAWEITKLCGAIAVAVIQGPPRHKGAKVPILTQTESTATTQNSNSPAISTSVTGSTTVSIPPEANTAITIAQQHKPTLRERAGDLLANGLIAGGYAVTMPISAIAARRNRQEVGRQASERNAELTLWWAGSRAKERMERARRGERITRILPALDNEAIQNAAVATERGTAQLTALTDEGSSSADDPSTTTTDQESSPAIHGKDRGQDDSTNISNLEEPHALGLPSLGRLDPDYAVARAGIAAIVTQADQNLQHLLAQQRAQFPAFASPVITPTQIATAIAFPQVGQVEVEAVSQPATHAITTNLVHEVGADMMSDNVIFVPLIQQYDGGQHAFRFEPKQSASAAPRGIGLTMSGKDLTAEEAMRRATEEYDFDLSQFDIYDRGVIPHFTPRKHYRSGEDISPIVTQEELAAYLKQRAEDARTEEKANARLGTKRKKPPLPGSTPR